MAFGRELESAGVDQSRSGPPADPVVEAYKKDIDRTLIRENLRLGLEERFLRLMELQRLAEELRKAGHNLRTRA